MSYQVVVLRIEKIGPYILPLTVKTYEPEVLSDYDALVSQLCDQYANRKDIKIVGSGHSIHKDWDESAVLAGWLYPGQYTMYPCTDHMEYDETTCWHVYDPMRKNEFGERYCVHAHVSYVEACKATGQEYYGLESENREEENEQS